MKEHYCNIGFLLKLNAFYIIEFLGFLNPKEKKCLLNDHFCLSASIKTDLQRKHMN